MFFSVIVPTFSRPDEVFELLTSLESQNNENFEVILADGSLDDSVKDVAEKFNEKLKLLHLHQKGLGISESRNWGVENASGDWLVFFDSDCVIPPQYFTEVENSLNSNPLDAYGGPDRAAETFNNRQKAISYAMTSFFTTGGIRGKKQHVGQYQPRGFNMGIRKDVFLSVGGYSGLKVSEDIDLSMRLYKKGYKTGLIETAYVYHKRRSTFYKFFRQVSSFGSGRIDLHLRHGDALKPVHLLPAMFVLYLAGGILTGLFSKTLFLLWLASVVLYMALIFLDATIQNRSPVVGLLSLYAAFIMLTGYGIGMLKAMVMRMILGSRKESEKPEITKEA
ncbi:MAG: glycosyltransferase [Bacteroidales bacterium]|nr:glycosyltransferase [Bacteroidales bacterium]